MSDLREAAKLALIALENGTSPNLWLSTKENLRKALEEQPEPIAWMVYSLDGQSWGITDNPMSFSENQRALPLWAGPFEREWVGLTDEDLKPLCNQWKIMYGGYVDDFARAIEAKLKEKNT